MKRRTFIATTGAAILAGCGEAAEEPEPGDSDQISRSKNTETSTPTETETETPTQTEETITKREEIATRLNVFVGEVLSVGHSSPNGRDIEYLTSATSVDGVLAEVAKVAGTNTYLVDKGKADSDWYCRVYIQVEGEGRKFLGHYWIFVSDTEAYINGNLNKEEFYNRILDTWETAE